MSVVRRSVLLSLAERHSAFVVQFASTMVLARLLTPRDVGIFSVAMVFVNLAHVLRDFGVGQYLVQEPELNRERVRTAFGIAIGMGWSMAAALAAAAPFAAGFYKEPGVKQVLNILVINFLLLPFITVPLALWRREMNFTIPYFIKTSGVVVHALAAIALAALGYGYLSMAWAAVASVATNVFLGSVVWRHRDMSWRPGFRGGKRVLSFTAPASSATVLREVSAGGPDLVVGRMLGMTEVGLLGRATGLVNMFEKYFGLPVLGVFLPHLAGCHRSGGNVKAEYLRMVEMFTGLAWPFFGVLGVLAFPVIRVLYGSQWDDAVPLARILCLYGALSATFYFSGHALTAVGAVVQSARVEALNAAVLFALLIALSPFGLASAATAVVLASVVTGGIWLAKLRQVLSILPLELLRAVWQSLVLAASAVFVPVLLTTLGEGHGLLIELLGGMAGAAVGWVAALLAIRHPLREQMLKTLGSLAAWLRRR